MHNYCNQQWLTISGYKRVCKAICSISAQYWQHYRSLQHLEVVRLELQLRAAFQRSSAQYWQHYRSLQHLEVVRLELQLRVSDWSYKWKTTVTEHFSTSTILPKRQIVYCSYNVYVPLLDIALVTNVAMCKCFNCKNGNNIFPYPQFYFMLITYCFFKM